MNDKALINTSASEEETTIRVDLKTNNVSISSVTEKKQHTSVFVSSDSEEDEVLLAAEDQQEVDTIVLARHLPSF